MKPETPNASHTTPHFWHKMQKEIKEKEVSWLAALWPKKARSARQEVNL